MFLIYEFAAKFQQAQLYRIGILGRGDSYHWQDQIIPSPDHGQDAQCRDRRQGQRQVLWIHVDQNFVELAEARVLLPWKLLRKAAAATEMMLQSVLILGLVPQMVGRNKAASPTQKQFLVLPVRSEV